MQLKLPKITHKKVDFLSNNLSKTAYRATGLNANFLKFYMYETYFVDYSPYTNSTSNNTFLLYRSYDLNNMITKRMEFSLRSAIVAVIK